MHLNEDRPNLFNFENSYLELPEVFYKKTSASKVSKPKLILFNSPLFEMLTGTSTNLSSDDLAQVLSGNLEAKHSFPMALTYAGHQFGHFVPLLGDGRALLLGEVTAQNKNRYDVQLKGSGVTAFSRGGDGRAPLGPMIREYICSEAMFNLGVPTTRALALVLTGDNVQRESVLPGAVLTRVALSHLRIGTFEYFASRGDYVNLKILADHTIERHYPKIAFSENPYLELLKKVVQAQASLISQWMSLGFIHGVMNTDNMTLSGETIDYGPCAFMDYFDPMKVYSSIDRNGRYAFSNQPKIAEWNLSVLASCLLPLIIEPKKTDWREKDFNANDKYSKEIIALVQNEIDDFKVHYKFHWLDKMRSKLGLTNKSSINPTCDESDDDLIQYFLNLLHQQRLDYTLAFRYLADSIDMDFKSSKLGQLFHPQSSIEVWHKLWMDRQKLENQKPEQIKKNLKNTNPLFIPRNHIVEKVINSAYSNDFNPLFDLVESLRNPFQESNEKNVVFTNPPKPEEVVSKTFCGT